MAQSRRTTGVSITLIGRQKVRGEYIIGADALQGKKADWSDLNNIVPALITQRFPYTRNTLDPNSDTVRSESILGGNASAPDVIVGRAGAGEWEFEVFPDDAIHLLLGWFNPNPLPTNTTIESRTGAGVIPAAKITNAPAASGRQIITIDNEGNDAPIADKWPGKLNLAFPSAGALAGSGQILINGVQRRSRSNKFNAQAIERIATTAADLQKTAGIDTKKFYRQINRIVLTGFSTFGAEAEKPTLKFKADTNHAILKLHPTSDVFAGWTSQMDKAGTPYIAFDIVPNSFTLNISAGSMRLSFTLLASFVQEGRVLVDIYDIAYKVPKYDRPATGEKFLEFYEKSAENQKDQKLVLSNYPVRKIIPYPSNGTAVALGEVGQTIDELKAAVDAGTATIIPVTNVEITGTHNYGDPIGWDGDPVGGEPVTAEGQTREVNVNATILHQTDETYSLDNKTVFWQDRFFEGQVIPIIISNYSWEDDGRQDLIQTILRKCKLSEVPALPIDGQGQASRTLAFSAETSQSGTPDEIEMHFYSQHGFKE